MRALAPCMRRLPGNVHIGEAGLRMSTSMWAQNVLSFACTSLGNQGTSTSTSMPTSALGRCLSGWKPMKHGLSCEMLLVMFDSNTAMPASSASSSISSEARGSRPA